MDGLRRYLVEVEVALADDGDPWEAFAAFMRRAVDADTSSLTLHLAGSFTPTEAHWRDGEKALQLNTRLLNRTKAAGDLRPEFEVGDLSLLFEQLAAIKVDDPERTRQLRQRFLALLLDALRDAAAPPLPGPPRVGRRSVVAGSVRSRVRRGEQRPLRSSDSRSSPPGVSGSPPGMSGSAWSLAGP